MADGSVIVLGQNGSLTIDGDETSLEKLEVRLKRDQAQNIKTPLTVRAPTNTDWAIIGTLVELANRFDRSVDAVAGN